MGGAYERLVLILGENFEASPCEQLESFLQPGLFDLIDVGIIRFRDIRRKKRTRMKSLV
jgi:hypothetical protein